MSSIRMTAIHPFSYNAFRRKGNYSGIQGVYHLLLQAWMPVRSGAAWASYSGGLGALSYGIEAVARGVSGKKLVPIICESRIVTGPGWQWRGRV